MKQIILIVIILFLALLIYLVSSPPHDITLEEMLKYSPPPVTVTTGTEDTVIPKEDTVIPEVDHKIPEVDPVIPETTLSDSSQAGNVDEVQIFSYIIIESSKNLTSAQQKAKILEKEFNVHFFVLPPNAKGYYRISCGKYSTLEEARSKIKSVKANIRPDAWILTQ
jgi:hypothetical protein